MPDSVCKELRKLYERHVNAYWDKAWHDMTERLKFLAGDRFVEDTGEFNKDRRRVQIRGMETQDTIRHLVAKLTERPRSIEGRPLDKIDDPDLTEGVVAILSWDVDNPDNGFDDRLEGCILDACKMGLGVVWTDLIPPGQYGHFAKRIPRRVDPRNIMWDEAFEDPHEPGCTFVLERCRLPVAQIHAMYPGSKWVKPDRVSLQPGTQNAKTGYPILNVGGRHVLANQNVDDDKATLWKCWYKNDWTKSEKPYQSDDEEVPREKQRYACSSGCGWRGKTIAELEAEGMNPPEELEPELPPRDEENPDGGCPTCGGGMTLLTHRRVDKYARAFRNGKRLVIIAPFQHEGEEKAIYDGEWPQPDLRSFPALFLTEYQEPGLPVGKCEVDNSWDQQVASDQLLTHAIRQVFQHQIYWQMPSAGVTNWQGERFGFRDDDYNVMYVDQTVAAQFGMTIQPHRGIGLDPNFGTAFSLVQQKLTAYRPSGDIGLSEDQTKDIAVGTVEAIERQGETPVEHLNRRKNRALSRYYSVRWDMLRASLTPEELVRLRIDGTDVLMAGLEGGDLPGYDFWLEDSPRFAGIDLDRAKAYQALMQEARMAARMGQDPMLAVEIFGDIHSLPKSVTRKVQKLFSQSQQMGPMGGGMPGEEGLPPEMGLEAGLNGADMGSVPAA